MAGDGGVGTSCQFSLFLCLLLAGKREGGGRAVAPSLIRWTSALHFFLFATSSSPVFTFLSSLSSFFVLHFFHSSKFLSCLSLFFELIFRSSFDDKNKSDVFFVENFVLLFTLTAILTVEVVVHVSIKIGGAHWSP